MCRVIGRVIQGFRNSIECGIEGFLLWEEAVFWEREEKNEAVVSYVENVFVILEYGASEVSTSSDNEDLESF